MTSQRQIAANRLNAQRSTGPRTVAGKVRSRQNAIRHGLTAETVIGVLEKPEDYRAFERSIVKDYRPRSTLEYELVVRLASLLWRLRRATAIETGLFAIQAGIQQGLSRESPQGAMGIFEEIMRSVIDDDPVRPEHKQGAILIDDGAVKPSGPVNRRGISQCYLRLMNLNGDIFERVGHYERRLWGQVDQVLAALELRRPATR